MAFAARLAGLALALAADGPAPPVAPPAPPAPAAAPTKPLHYADCVAAVRDKATLDRRRLPSARFRMKTDAIGWENDEHGVPQTLYLRYGHETARLKSGVRLTVDLGGCEDYSNSYSFAISRDITPLSNGAYWLRKAAALVEEVAAVNRDPVAPLYAIAKSLRWEAAGSPHRKLAAEGLDHDFRPGETSYRVELSRKAGVTTLVVRYYVHL